MTAPVAAAGSVGRLRRWLLIGLVAGVAGLTGVVLVLGRSLSERFASQIEADLEWRALRGAQELSRTSELGLAVSDTAVFNKALDAYASSPDVQAVAVAIGDKLVTSRGTTASIAPVFTAPPGTLVRGDGYVASWAAPITLDARAGKIAVVVSTRRLADAQARQTHVSHLTLIAGVAALILGALAVLGLTRGVRVAAPAPVDRDPPAAADRDPPPAAPDHRDDEREAQARALDERDRSMRLMLDHAAQGFLTVELGGRLAGERSAIVDRWFGEPAADATLVGYLSPHDPALAAMLGFGLESLCEGVIPLPQCLDQMPKRLTAGASTFDLEYAPVLQGDRPERILLIISDVTEQVAREGALREQREQRELIALSQLITANRAEFDEFFSEAAGLVAALDAPSDPEVERRTVRALKDHCAYYGLETYVALCLGIEASLAETLGPLTDDQRAALAAGWSNVASRLARQLA
jgi:hypothetical protein